jgi:hypothetical protein
MAYTQPTHVSLPDLLSQNPYLGVIRDIKFILPDILNLWKTLYATHLYPFRTVLAIAFLNLLGLVAYAWGNNVDNVDRRKEDGSFRGLRMRRGSYRGFMKDLGKPLKRTWYFVLMLCLRGDVSW